jgi:endonuclease IV
MFKYGPDIKRKNFEANILKYPCCQIYLAGPYQSKWKPLEVPELPTDHSFFIHTPLNINMGYNDKDYMSPIISNCCKEVEGAPGSCVLHIGTCKGMKREDCSNMEINSPARKCLNLIAHRINKIKLPSSNNPKTLLLENAAGENGELGNSWKDIRLLFEALDNTGKIGLCLDTQHSYSSGLCSFETDEIVNKWLDKAQQISRIGLIHLNDSYTDYEGYRDSHAPLGEKIWRKNKASLEALLVRCYEDDIPMVCETGKFKEDNAIVQKIMENYELK